MNINKELQTIREEAAGKFGRLLSNVDDDKMVFVENEVANFYESHIRRLLEEQSKELFEAQDLIAELWVRILTAILPHENTKTLDFIKDKLEAYVTSITPTTDTLQVSK